MVTLIHKDSLYIFSDTPTLYYISTITSHQEMGNSNQVASTHAQGSACWPNQVKLQLTASNSQNINITFMIPNILHKGKFRLSINLSKVHMPALPHIV